MSLSTQQACVQFAREVAAGVLPSWREIASSRRQQAVEPCERDWQLLRRGRYLEFNLLYDRYWAGRKLPVMHYQYFSG